MDRQLSVWAATGLVVLAAVGGFVFGHWPGGPIEVGERHVPRVAPTPDESAIAESPATTTPSKPTSAGTPASATPSAPRPSETARADAPQSTPTPPASEPADSAVGGASSSTTPAADGPAGVVTGRIVFTGKAPAPRPAVAIPAAQAEECCAAEGPIEDRSLRVSADGGVADVVVIIKAKSAPADGAGVVREMDQRCCTYEPHVLLVPVGAELRYLNSDKANHNVHTYPKKNAQLNTSVAPGSSTAVKIQHDETFRVGCDIHPWMSAHVVATEYATAAVTALDGTFRIEGVPPGEHAVEIWAESAKPVEKKLRVRVEPGGETAVEWAVAAR